MFRILIISNIIFAFYTFSSAQENSKAIKFIPQASFKIGSQTPAVGGQFDLVIGLLMQEKYLVGIGGGYCTNMGMGGTTIPLYADGRFYFSLPKSVLFASKDESNDFQVEAQLGMDINNNLPYKTGFLAAFGLAYRFDFIKIQTFKLPAFYAGLNIEYNHSPFKDEYRGYIIQDGYLNHVMLNFKVAFEINPIKL
ncbi:MAG: hypothetical protein P1P88_10090 [Bacteroidales bacterium]|nr:hypothetical protein [Bacteroidales bacterium]